MFGGKRHERYCGIMCQGGNGADGRRGVSCTRDESGMKWLDRSMERENEGGLLLLLFGCIVI